MEQQPASQSWTDRPIMPNMPAPKPHHVGLWTFGIIAVVAIAVAAWWLFPRFGAPGAGIPGGGATLTATASVAEADVGGQFTVDIMLDTGQLSVSAADLVVTYDSNLLKAVGITAGQFLPVELAGGAAGNGRATMTVASGTTPATGSGVVLSLTFKALTPGRAVIGAAAGTQISAVGQSGNVVGLMTPVTVTIR